MIILNGQSEIDRYLRNGIDSITLQNTRVTVVLYPIGDKITKPHKWTELLNMYRQEIQTKAKEKGIL